MRQQSTVDVVLRVLLGAVAKASSIEGSTIVFNSISDILEAQDTAAEEALRDVEAPSTAVIMATLVVATSQRDGVHGARVEVYHDPGSPGAEMGSLGIQEELQEYGRAASRCMRSCVTWFHPALSGGGDNALHDETREVEQQEAEDRMINLLMAAGSSQVYLLWLNRCIRLISAHAEEVSHGQPFIIKLGETFWRMIGDQTGVRPWFALYFGYSTVPTHSKYEHPNHYLELV